MNHTLSKHSTEYNSTFCFQFPSRGTIRTACLVVCASFVVSACQARSDAESAPALAYQSTYHLDQPDNGTEARQSNQLTTAYIQTGITRKGDSTWFATISDDFLKAKKLVEAELSIDLRTISLDVVDDRQIDTEVKNETRQLVEEQFGRTPFSKGFLQQIMHPLAGTYAALYSPRLKTVMISRPMLANYENSLSDNHKNDKHAALMTLLIHELVHAADDLRFNIRDNRTLNFRASFAQSATFEGHAQWVTRRICQLAACISGLDALGNFMFNDQQLRKDLTQPIEAISRSALEYSYIEGELFVNALSKRDQGERLIAELLQNPPSDPIQILSPETFPDNERKQRNRKLINAGITIDHTWGRPPWTGVETSPLKGVDLRSNLARRQAAINGFTKLITGMVSLQFYNQQLLGSEPIEATVLQTDSSRTADLFAGVLHANTQQAHSEVSEERLLISSQDTNRPQPTIIHVRRTAIKEDIHYRSTVAVSGKHVVQVSGNTHEDQPMDDYAIQVLLNLSSKTAPTQPQ